MKTDRLKIEWPATAFGIDEIQRKYKDVPNITIRFRINRSLKNGELIKIGKNLKSTGRPTLLFAKSTISNEQLLKLQNDGVILTEQMSVLVGNFKNVNIENAPKVSKKEEPININEHIRVKV
jgi:hypothetical protein